MALIGYFFGIFFAAAGIGYLWLGLLWAIQVRKHWPRAAYGSAAAVAGLIGVITAFSAGTTATAVLATLGTLAAVAFIVWRSRSVLFPKIGTAALPQA